MSLTRRQLLASTVAASMTGIVATQVPAEDALAAADDPSDHGLPSSLDLETATVAQLNELLDSGRISSEQLTRAYIDRIAALSSQAPALNAVRALNPRALAEARAADVTRERKQAHGPLLGIPVLLKDNIDVAGMPTTAGSVALAQSRPSTDAPLVAQLRRAGAVILGKANLTEFANFLTTGMPSGYSSLGGQVGLVARPGGTGAAGPNLSPAVANPDVGIKAKVGLNHRPGNVPIAAS